jgi:Tfp pilus assembly protein PilV
MRALHPALLLTVGALALAGCGSSDDTDDAAVRQEATTTETQATTPTVATPTEAAPAAAETTTNTTTTTAPPASAPESSSGGTTPPSSSSSEDSGGTAPPKADPAPSVDGDQPSITVRGDGTARAVASDAGQAEVWCDNARQGSYDAQLGDATTLVIAVSGSDATQRCELPR